MTAPELSSIHTTSTPPSRNVVHTSVVPPGLKCGSESSIAVIEAMAPPANV